MRVPTIPRMRAGASPPAAVAAPIGGLASYETREGITLRDAFHRTQYAIGSGPQVPLLSLRGDPALRGMGIASAVVSGCCSVPEPNREQCLRALPTTEMYRPRDRNEETAIPTNN